MNYTSLIIAILIIVSLVLLDKNIKLRRLNLSLYEKHSVMIETGSFDIRRADITYFIKKSRERSFNTLSEQVDFLERALKASGYGTETFKEKEFRSLVRDRGFEDVTITARR